jgi:MFS transporter, PPP family, 3-phenylpropionic acid transporter
VSLRRLRLLYASYGIAMGFLTPWNVPQMLSEGLSPEAIGLVLGSAALASMLAYPLWGIVADTVLGRDRTLLLSGILGAGAGVGLLVAGSQPPLLAAFVVLASVFAAPLAPVSDALALGVLGEDPRAYGRLRLMASAGWIAGVLVAGPLYAVAGPIPVRALYVVASLVIGVAVAAGRSTAPPAPAPRVTRERPTVASVRAAMRFSPVFLPFLGVLLLATVATSASWSFVTLRILDEGGGPILIGVSAAMPAIAEIPLFASVGRLTDRFGLRALFSIGCLITASQMLVVALAPSAAIVAVVRLLDGAGYALRYTATVIIAGSGLPGRLRATGQSMTWLVMSGIAPVVSGPAGGWIYGTFGGMTLFTLCATLISAAAGLAWLVLRPLGVVRPASAPAGP